MGEGLDSGLIGGRYRLIRRLGRGGMGEVFLAEVDTPSERGQKVAVKVLRAEAAEDQAVEMFLSEARLAVQLTHPNIVQVYDLGRWGDDYFIAMEYVPGVDLRRVIKAVDLREDQVPVDLSAYLVRQLCRGLEHAHRLTGRDGEPLGLVHRDISPANCLLGFDGAVKLIDFGIAKIAGVKRTRTGVVRGKVAYLSPEQAQGLKLDRRSDLFSLGVVLYELLAGARPFDLEDDNELNVVRRIISGEHPTAASLQPQVPAALDAIIEKALRVSPDERFQTAADLALALDQYLETSSTKVDAGVLGAFVQRLNPGTTEELQITEPGPTPRRPSVQTAPMAKPTDEVPPGWRPTVPTMPETPLAAAPTRLAPVKGGLGARWMVALLMFGLAAGLALGWWLGGHP